MSTPTPQPPAWFVHLMKNRMAIGGGVCVVIALIILMATAEIHEAEKNRPPTAEESQRHAEIIDDMAKQSLARERLATSPEGQTPFGKSELQEEGQPVTLEFLERRKQNTPWGVALILAFAGILLIIRACTRKRNKD